MQQQSFLEPRQLGFARCCMQTFVRLDLRDLALRKVNRVVRVRASSRLHARWHTVAMDVRIPLPLVIALALAWILCLCLCVVAYLLLLFSLGYNHGERRVRYWPLPDPREYTNVCCDELE